MKGHRSDQFTWADSSFVITVNASTFATFQPATFQLPAQIFSHKATSLNLPVFQILKMQRWPSLPCWRVSTAAVTHGSTCSSVATSFMISLPVSPAGTNPKTHYTKRTQKAASGGTPSWPSWLLSGPKMGSTLGKTHATPESPVSL